MATANETLALTLWRTEAPFAAGFKATFIGDDGPRPLPLGKKEEQEQEEEEKEEGAEEKREGGEGEEIGSGGRRS